MPIQGIRRLVPNIEFPGSHVAVAEMLADTPALSVILSEEYSLNFDAESHSIATLRKVSFWQALTKSILNCASSAESKEPFSSIEVMLIQLNFNAPAFTKYIAEKSLTMADLANSQTAL